MDCPICDDGKCLACRYEGAVRRMAETSPAHRDAIAARWRADSGGEIDPDWPPRGLGPQSEWTPTDDAPPPPIAPSVAALWLAKGCDHRGPVCGRGCSGDHRICGAGRGAVTLNQCLLCVADWSSPGGPALD